MGGPKFKAEVVRVVTELLDGTRTFQEVADEASRILGKRLLKTQVKGIYRRLRERVEKYPKGSKEYKRLKEVKYKKAVDRRYEEALR